MTDKNDTQQAENWGNYWQGRAASDADAALVGPDVGLGIGVGIETDAEIGAFWTGWLAQLPKSTRLLDMACGAGSVVRRATEVGLTDITGVDISSDAITTLKAACPKAKGVVASADATGLGAGCFDRVASQFGFEYADARKAAGEAVRLLAKGGSFLALAHSQDSAIEREVTRLGGEAKAILDCGFIERAKQLFTADKAGGPESSGSEAEFSKAAAAFAGPQAQLMTIARASGGLAAHLYQGTQTMFERRAVYDLADITSWLDGMAAEISAFVGRMDSMVQAALSEVEANAVLAVLEQGGLTPAPLEQFISQQSGDVLGWIIAADNKA